MLLQANKKDKRGLSIIIGYVLLIVISISMSILVYQWIKTYVPKDTPNCPDGISISIKDLKYSCADEKLNLTLKNNGRFSVHGYFIKASNKSGEEIATIDLSSKLISGGSQGGGSVLFSEVKENWLAPEDKFGIKSIFNTEGCGTLVKIEVIPTRIQEIDGKKRMLICSEAKIQEVLKCAEAN